MDLFLLRLLLFNLGKDALNRVVVCLMALLGGCETLRIV